MRQLLGGGGDAGVLVPVEALASHGSGVAGGGVVDGEVQRHGAVAAGNVGEDVRRGDGRSLGVGHTVPLEAFASHGGGVTGGGVVDGEVQRHGAVAAGDGGEHMRQGLGGGGDAGVLVPVEALAGRSDGVAGGAVVHGEDQRDDAVTAVGGGEGLTVGATLGVDAVVPLVAVAGDGVEGGGDRLLDGEAQRHGAVAAVDIAEGLRVGTRSGVLDLVPGVADAGGVEEAGGDRLVDGEVHRHGAVAAADGIQGLGVVAAVVIVAAFPDEVVAGGGVDAGLHAVVDGEVQRDDGAAVVAGDDVGRRHGGRLGVGAVMPGVAVAGRDGLHAAAGGGDGEQEGDGAVAAVAADGVEGRRHGGSGGVGAVMPGVAVAGRDGQRGRGGLLDGEGQGDGAVAAVAAREGLAVGTRSTVLDVVPHIAAADALAELVGRGLVDHEVQGHGAVAAVDGLVALGVGTAGGVVALSPDVVGAGGVVEDGVDAVVEGQVEGHRAVAAAAEVEDIDGCRLGNLGVGDTVDPGVALASLHDIGRGHVVADGQQEDDGAVAAVGGAADIGVGHRAVKLALGVGHAIDPGEAVAGLALVDTHEGMVEGQVQRGGAVAAVDVLGVVDAQGRRGVDDVVPLVHAVAGDDGLHGVVAVVHREVQTGDAVASHGIDGVVVGHGATEVDHTVPGELLADRGVEHTLGALLDGEVERGGAVASAGGLQGRRVDAALTVDAVVPQQGVAGHDGVGAAARDVGELGGEEAVGGQRDNTRVGAVTIAPLGEVVAVGRGGGERVLHKVLGGAVAASDATHGGVSGNGCQHIGIGVEGGVQGGVAHRRDNQGVLAAHHGAGGIHPAGEVVAGVRRGVVGGTEVVLHRVGRIGHKALDAVGFGHGDKDLVDVGVEDGGEGAVGIDKQRVVGDGAVHAVGLAPVHEVVAGLRGGDQGDDAVGHHAVGAVVNHGHEGLAVGNADHTSHTVGLEGQSVGEVQEVGHEGGVVGHDDGAHQGGAVKVVPVQQVVLCIGLGGDSDLGAGLQRVGVEAHNTHAVGHGGCAGDGEAAAGGDHRGGAFEGSVDADVVVGVVLDHQAVATNDLVNGAGL